MTNKQRMLLAARGEMPDKLPFAPRIDIWFNANSRQGNLPVRHRDKKSADQIALEEGWALHKVIANHAQQPDPDAMLHRALGVHSLREYVVKFEFSDQVGIDVNKEGDATRIRYTTPKGSLTTTTIYNDELKKAGIALPWITEYLIKNPSDYQIAESLFELMDVVPSYESFTRWKDEVGENGLPVTAFTLAAGPIHHIQKYLIEPTEFFFHYRDNNKEMNQLASVIAPLYDKALQLVADSPAEIINWGANFDEMITYPPFFEKDFVPYIRRAAEVLGPKNILLLCHTDGENLGLMDLLRDCGMNVADSVCPYPMTKVTIQEYYRRWGDKITIFGGVPSNMLLPHMATDQEFEGFMDDLFKGIAPGTRFIVGVADITTPDADFDRLVRLGQMVEEQGELPLKGGALRPQSKVTLERAAQLTIPQPKLLEKFVVVQQDVLQGRNQEILQHVEELLKEGASPDDIMQKGMIAAMEVINQKFKDGTVFIPEVLLASRAMNLAVEYLEPYLAAGEPHARGKVLIGTVKGDMHDIGKNMVSAMFRGVGFNVVDLGINVPVEDFVKAVTKEQPQILALSALLTTTMPELEKVIKALSQAGLREKVKVMVGGAPVSQRFADDIGADGYGDNAAEAVDTARSFTN